MRTEFRFALGIIGLLVLIAATGFGVFVYFGSGWGVYALVGGMVLTVIIGPAMYVRRIGSTGSKSADHYFNTKARSLGDAMRDVLQEYDDLCDRHPHIESTEFETEVDFVLDELADLGLHYDRRSHTYDIGGGSRDIQRLEELEAKLPELHSIKDRALEEQVQSVHGELSQSVNRLQSAGLLEADSVEFPSAPTEADDTPATDSLSTYRSRMHQIVSDSVTQLEEIAAETQTDQQAIKTAEQASTEALEADDFEGAVDEIIRARDRLESDLSASFQAKQEDLLSFLSTASESIAAEYVSASKIDELTELRDHVAAVDTALAVQELEDYTDRTRRASIEIVETMQDDLQRDVTTLRSTELPAEFWEEPAGADTDYAHQLRAADALDTFRSKWLNAVGELAGGLDAVSDKASVAEAYPEVAQLIDEQLTRTGNVEADDLPVKQPITFMEIYATTEPEVAFDPDVPSLTGEAHGAEYDITIIAGFEEGGPERSITVELAGDGFAGDERFETHLLDEVAFEAVPYGEYELSVETSLDGYESVTRSVLVNDDLDIDVRLASLTVHEEVCDGIESEVAENLPEVEDLLEERFAESEYLTDSMEFPLTEDYVPCFIATYAEERDLELVRNDDEIVAYDGDHFQNRLENIVEHNLDAGESIDFEAVRNRYLAVPVPDDRISTAVESLDADVEVDQTTITKS